MEGSITRRFAAVRQQPKAAATPFTYDAKRVFESEALALLPPNKVSDNLLLARSRDKAITFTIPLPDNADYDDTFQLLLNGKLFGIPVVINDFIDDGTDIAIILSAADRKSVPEGIVTINYVIRFVSGAGDAEYGPPNQTFITDYALRCHYRTYGGHQDRRSRRNDYCHRLRQDQPRLYGGSQSCRWRDEYVPVADHDRYGPRYGRITGRRHASGREYSRSGEYGSVQAGPVVAG